MVASNMKCYHVCGAITTCLTVFTETQLQPLNSYILIFAEIEQQGQKAADTVRGKEISCRGFFFFFAALSFFTVGGKLMARETMTPDLEQLRRTRGRKCHSLKHLSR